MEKVEFITKSTYAYERLKQEIMDGVLRQGEKLVVNAISQRYQVSPMPIREALLRLEQEGLVQSAPHQGAWVHTCNYEQFFELIQVSIALESCACRLAAALITGETLKELKQLAEGMEEDVARMDIPSYQEHNHSFHMMIYRSCGNQELYELVQNTHRRTYPYTSIALHTSGRLSMSLQEHLNWLDALARRDGDTCVRLCRQQRLESYSLFLGFLEDCLKDPEDAKNNYYLYGYSDTFAGMTTQEIAGSIAGYRSRMALL